jgi:hypothetical protein
MPLNNVEWHFYCGLSLLRVPDIHLLIKFYT